MRQGAITASHGPFPGFPSAASGAAAFGGRRVFVTGHTGFKGSWLALWLERLGAEVFGYALPPPTSPSSFVENAVEQRLAGHWLADIRHAADLAAAVDAAAPELIFHLAAQPLVRESYRCPLETHEVNYLGTANLLEAVRRRGKPCVVVVVTTDKCYHNREQVWGYRETDRLGGHDPYSASKAAVELLVASYRDAFFPVAGIDEHGVRLATARAGNVIGGGDWADDRIVPDLVRAITAGEPLEIRRPEAVRPWQHVLEPLGGYLLLAASMLSESPGVACSAWNFGPLPEGSRTVGELADAFIGRWGKGAWHPPAAPPTVHETTRLQLAIDKAVQLLGWRPRWDFSTTINRTADWYRRWSEGRGGMAAATLADIEAYEQTAGPAAQGSRPALNVSPPAATAA